MRRTTGKGDRAERRLDGVPLQSDVFILAAARPPRRVRDRPMRPRLPVRRSGLALAAALALLAGCAHVQETVVPNANLKVEGIPPIPAALAAKVAPYTEFRPTGLASWHPVRHELVVAKRARNTAQLFDVRAPLADPVQLTDFAEPVRNGGWWPAKPDVLVFGRDAGGNEQSQLYRLDPGAKEPVLLTDPARTHRPLALNRARDRLLVASTDVDKAGGRRENPTLDVTLVDPLDPAGAKKIATLPGTGWGDFSFSFDDRRLAMSEFRSVTETYVWVMDLATGERRRVLPAPGADPTRHRRVDRSQLLARRQGTVPHDRPRRRVPACELPRSRHRRARGVRPGELGRRAARALARRPHDRDGRQRGRRRRAAALRCGHAPRAAAPAGADRRGGQRPVAPGFDRARVQPRLVAEPGGRLRARRSPATASRAGPSRRSRGSTRRDSPCRRRSNGRASTAGRSPDSSHGRPSSSRAGAR